MIAVSLRDFARTGAFGPVELGAARDRVRESLGAPDGWGGSGTSERTAAIWKYGTTEFHFADDALGRVYSDDFEVPEGGSRVALDPWIVRSGLAIGALERGLGAEGIAWKQAPYPPQPGTTLVRSAAGVCFAFGTRDGQPLPGLWGLWLSDRETE